MGKLDPTKLKQVKEHRTNDILFRVRTQPGGSSVVIGSSSAKVLDVDLEAEKFEPQTFDGHTSYVTGLVTDESRTISGSYDGKLIWWNPESREPLRTIEAHAKWIRNLDLSPDGKLIASVADDMVARVWNAESGKQVFELKGHDAVTPNHFPSMLYCCAFSHDGKLLATGDRIGKVIVWDVKSGKQVKTFTAPGVYTWDPKARIHSIGGLRSLAFSPDDKSIAIGGMGHVGNIDHLGGKSRVELYDWQSGEQQFLYESGSFKGLVERLVFDPESQWLLAAGGDNSGFLQFIDPKAGKSIRDVKAPMHVHDIALDVERKTIFGVGHQRAVAWKFEG